jgi:hypothetical protein
MAFLKEYRQFSAVVGSGRGYHPLSMSCANLLHRIEFVNPIMVKYVVALKKMRDADFPIGQKWSIFRQIHQFFGIADFVFSQAAYDSALN